MLELGTKKIVHKSLLNEAAVEKIFAYLRRNVKLEYSFRLLSIFCSPRYNLNGNIVCSVVDKSLRTGITSKSSLGSQNCERREAHTLIQTLNFCCSLLPSLLCFQSLTPFSSNLLSILRSSSSPASIHIPSTFSLLPSSFLSFPSLHCAFSFSPFQTNKPHAKLLGGVKHFFHLCNEVPHSLQGLFTGVSDKCVVKLMRLQTGFEPSAVLNILCNHENFMVAK